MFLDTLAAAYAEAGQYDKAVSVQKEATALLQDEAQKQDYASRLKLYESNTPFRDHSTTAPVTFAEKYTYVGGYFGMLTNSTPHEWKEGKTRTPEVYSFEELERNEEVILLRDASRKFRVKIPVKGGMCRLSIDDGATWRNLSEVRRE